MLFYLQRIRLNNPPRIKCPTTVRQNSAWKPRTHPGAANEIPRSEKWWHCIDWVYIQEPEWISPLLKGTLMWAWAFFLFHLCLHIHTCVSFSLPEQKLSFQSTWQSKWGKRTKNEEYSTVVLIKLVIKGNPRIWGLSQCRLSLFRLSLCLCGAFLVADDDNDLLFWFYFSVFVLFFYLFYYYYYYYFLVIVVAWDANKK